MATRRITLVTDELLGYVRTGGIGTATTFLAVGLGRMGHDVTVLYAGDPPSRALEPEWADLYEGAGVKIKQVPPSDEHAEPAFFARMRSVERTLAATEPEVVVVQDLAAPTYTALRKRQLGLAFERTLFVVYCHGTRLWITDMAGKVRVLPGALAISVLEQACVELADVVVSPSAYLLKWMQRQRWQLPELSLVIPYLTRAVATGEPQARLDVDSHLVERLAFFGRLEERKGLRTFAAGLNAVQPELLRNVELDFVGAATPAWPRERITGLLSERTKSSLRRISFATDLDQPQALERLSRPGTLAVMPSRGETFSNAVYECLQHGIPFIASDAGAPRELVATEDRDRVLFEPTAEGVTAALERVLGRDAPWPPAEPAFEAREAYDAWADIVSHKPPARLCGPNADWELLTDRELPAEVVDKLASAQAASDADIVTCAVNSGSGVNRYFLGDPGGLGVLRNHYGTVALVRRSLLPSGAARVPRWELLARLVLDGANIVSIPEPLLEQPEHEEDPATALRVVAEFERHLPRSLRDLARLAAGLAAAPPTPAPSRSRLRRRLRLR
jgi:glycosyltransferase involved in cell wall biosynthesis